MSLREELEAARARQDELLQRVFAGVDEAVVGVLEARRALDEAMAKLQRECLDARAAGVERERLVKRIHEPLGMKVEGCRQMFKRWEGLR